MAKTVWTDTQVINQLDSGYHLSGTNLTYGFPTNASWFPYGEATGFSAFTAAQQQMATLAISLWDDLTPVNFTLKADGGTATVKYSNTTTNIGYAQAYYPGTWSGASSAWFNPNYNSGSGTNNLIPPTIGQWGWSAYVHETGHALGLDHPGTYNGGSPTYANDALYMQDSQQYTIMSYFSASNTGADWVASDGNGYYAQTPMIDDIMTIQAMYGVSTTTRTGDTVYGFNSNAGVSVFDFTQNLHPVVAIFDSAGSDTIDLSGWNTPSLINLTPGSFSNADAMTYNISIARTAWIENAVGGGGADTLIGNVQNNRLTGNAGNDSIDGGFGIDTAVFSGTLSNYTIVWNIGTDSFTITDNRTTGSTGMDTLRWVENFQFADQTVAASTYQVGGTAISVLASDASKLEGNSGSTAFTFVVVRDGDLSQAASVNYAVTGSGTNAATGADFTGGVLPSGIVQFAAGQGTATVTINVAGETVGELDEGFTVTLSGATGGAVIANATASGTILTDETAPSLAIAATNAAQSEGDSGSTAFTFTVTRSGDTSLAGSVNYAVTGTGTNAANGADFTGGALPTGTVNFAAGASSATVTVNVAGDTTVENDETFAVTLSGATGGATISTATATGTIQNNDGTFNIAAASATKAEGASGSTAFTFTVTRSGSAAAAATVNWSVNGGTATASDFSGGALPSGTLNFGAGQTSATITVNVAGDTTVESDETFTVTLASPTGGFVPVGATAPYLPDTFAPQPSSSGRGSVENAAARHAGVHAGGAAAGGTQPAQAASIGTASATGTIQNDDSQVSITTPSVSLSEGNSGTTVLSFTVTRTGLTTGTATANWAVSGTDVNVADFAGGVLPSGTVNFAANQTSVTILVNVAGDTVVEGNEGFTVTLTGATGATIGTATSTGTITNDDASLAISTGTPSVAEGNSGTTPYTFTVTRTGDLSGAASANWTVSGAVDAADFGGVLPSGTVNFAPGDATATISLAVAGDTALEGDEAFTVTLSNATGATIGTAAANGAITNDDTAGAGPPVISLATASLSVAEGNAGSTAFTYTISRTGDLTQASSVNWAVAGSGGSAADLADFGGVLPSGTANFAPGAATATVTVNVAGDTSMEANEGFTLTLLSATNGTLGTATSGGTILNDDSSIAIAADAASVVEGNSGTTPYTFTVTRTGDLSGVASANWAVSGVGVNAADFVGGVIPSGTVNFAAGAATATITVNVAGDTAVEANEAFAVTLLSASGTTIGTASANGTITNDDASLAISTGTASVVEGNGGTTPYTFTVTRTGDLTGTASANWAVSGAVDAADFGGTLPSGAVNFAASAATATITLNVSGDTALEGNEAFTVTLTGATGATIGTAAANGAITNDDAILAISTGTASVAEGNSGTTPYTFTVTRTGDLTGTASANWTVSGAVDAADFGGTLPSGTVNFTAGVATATITLNVAGDTALEGNEAFTVTLTGATGATIGTASANGTITNDDASLAISTGMASVSEGNSGTTPYTFTVTRTGNLSGVASANWTVSGAVDAADFGGTLPSGTVNFAAGAATATITLNVSGDTVVEGDEAFTVTLSNATGATIGTAAANGAIISDDLATSFPGTTGNDVLDKSAMTQNLTFDLNQGGNDTAIGGSGADSFFLGGAFTAADAINGGAGADGMTLSGNYAVNMVLAATSLTNVERLTLAAGNSYNLTTNDANVAAGATLTVDASALASINAATVSGAAETNGSFSFIGGAGADTFIGGTGADTFRGGLGADVLTGSAGADRFVYGSAADSAVILNGQTISIAGTDRLNSFATTNDVIDLSAFGFTGALATVVAKGASGFTTTATNGFFGTSAVAVEYAQRGQTAQVYVDVSRDGNLGAGDLLIQITGVTKNSLSASNFSFI